MFPVLIVHFGTVPHLQLCITNALDSGNNVVWLTDQGSIDDKIINKHERLTIVNAYDYMGSSGLMQKKYVHCSPNSYNYELICILRWFVCHEYMKAHNIKRACACDSDVLIFDNIGNIDSACFSDQDFMLVSSNTNNVSGHTSIWNIDKLGEFVNYCKQFYDTNSREHIINTMTNEKGGICDMTLLYYFLQNHSVFVGLRIPGGDTVVKKMVNDLSVVWTFNNESITFDHTINSTEHCRSEIQYEKDENNSKHVINKKGGLYCRNIKTGEYVRFMTLHFQGGYKSSRMDRCLGVLPLEE